MTAALAWATLPLAVADVRYLAVTAGVMTGFVVGPDLDLDGLSGAEMRVIRRSRVLGFVWWLLWLPYAKLFKHRGSSHWPVIGTLGRALYLLGPPLLGLYLLDVRIPWEWLGLWFCGLTLADLAHIIADRFWSAWKRKARRMSRKWKV